MSKRVETKNPPSSSSCFDLCSCFDLSRTAPSWRASSFDSQRREAISRAPHRTSTSMMIFHLQVNLSLPFSLSLYRLSRPHSPSLFLMVYVIVTSLSLSPIFFDFIHYFRRCTKILGFSDRLV
eukprot:TRINITY_DN300_c2_g1_i7.p1 TRINITY_DN300_c2_g1~~TRINITY_DN300_c2_g1_i7.p1  ORF type:complete len:123 (+),score=9.79 TRINITY_DN300_c2_g1_i7:860-1228(+)